MTIQNLLNKLNLSKTTDKFWVGNGSNPGLMQFARIGHVYQLLKALANQPEPYVKDYIEYKALWKINYNIGSGAYSIESGFPRVLINEFTVDQNRTYPTTTVADVDLIFTSSSFLNTADFITDKIEVKATPIYNSESSGGSQTFDQFSLTYGPWILKDIIDGVSTIIIKDFWKNDPSLAPAIDYLIEIRIYN